MKKLSKKNPDKGKPISQKVPVWTTREGERIAIDAMKDSHLENAINFLERKIATYQMKFSEYEDWEDGPILKTNPMYQSFVILNVLKRERDRRRELTERETRIEIQVSLEFEGPGLLQRVV